MEKDDKVLNWAIKLQSIAQAGLYYSKDAFDTERFQQIRDISAEMLSFRLELPAEKVKALFCNETGYQTPKLDTRAAIFRDKKILLVKEKDGKWSLPGGWVDAYVSVGENVVKEAKEEAGVDVKAKLVIALHDRAKHNQPPYAYNICKVFVLCDFIGGEFKENTETIASGYFGINELPQLSEAKNNREQIEMCFEAYSSENWKTILD